MNNMQYQAEAEQRRPYIWEMIKEAMSELYVGEKVGYRQIKDWVIEKYGDVNENTLNAQIIVCVVNHPSRVHYPENSKPRIANAKYDFLYLVSKGQVVTYNPDEHGLWEIKHDDYGKLTISQVLDEEPDEDSEDYLFPLESHLRDFIAKNVETLRFNGKTLRLFVDDTGRNGIEYPTDVGQIDVLATDVDGNFVVFELKLDRGPDKALGQLLRYMGWLKSKMAGNKKVFGVIVAKRIDEKLKYAINVTENIELFEYELNFKIAQAGKL